MYNTLENSGFQGDSKVLIIYSTEKSVIMTKKNVPLIVFVCTISMFVILLVSHAYNDIIITTRHGINFWYILKSGELFDFYNVNRVASGNDIYADVQGCAYNILVYIVFAVWNLPLLFLEIFANVDVMNSILCLVYSKMLVVACLVITALVLRKILSVLEIPKENHSLILYLYVTSSLMVTVTFITAQYDMLSLIFQLLGFLAFLKRKDKEFILSFGIAFCFKYFAAVIFLPLMLLRHKRISTWMQHLAMLLVPVILTKLPFFVYTLFFSEKIDSGELGDTMAASFLKNMLDSATLTTSVNIFVMVYIVLLAWSYLQDNESEYYGYYGAWVCMVAYAMFFGLMEAYPYWSVLLAPFVTLVISMAPNYLYLNLLLETIGYAGLVGVNMMRYPWVYWGDTLRSMIWPHILANTRFHPDYTDSVLYGVINMLHYRVDVHVLVNSVFLAAVIILSYTTYPVPRRYISQLYNRTREVDDVLLLRFFINTFICMLPILAIFL